MKDYGSRHADIDVAMRELAPRVLPVNVRCVADYDNAKWYSARLRGDVKLRVCLEIECIDGALWAHLSMSGPDHCLHLYAPLEKDPLPDFRGRDSTGTLAI